MRIDQRNNGASVTPAVDGYTLDRWSVLISQASKFSVEQTISGVVAPVGFTDYLGCTSLSAYSVLTADYFTVRQAIEGFNIADLGWGTANAKTVTLSFWVRSSLTGTFGGSFQNNTSARSYPYTYTISTANTWEQKSVTIAGDTSGTWQTGNLTGIFIYFGLGVGSTFSGTAGAWAGSNFLSATGATSVVGTNGATFYITGVQLEAGSVATPFERRDYGRELAMCQRYYCRFQGQAGAPTPICAAFLASTTSAQGSISFPVTMRANPTQSGSAAADVEVTWSAGTSATSALTLDLVSPNNALLRITTSGLTTGQGAYYRVASGATKFLDFSAEL
jgi:hypothetical protein